MDYQHRLVGLQERLDLLFSNCEYNEKVNERVYNLCSEFELIVSSKRCCDHQYNLYLELPNGTHRYQYNFDGWYSTIKLM